MAYSAYPQSIGSTLDAAASQLRYSGLFSEVRTWRENPIPGSFIQTTVRNQIDSASIVAADISVPNFNVTYEIGFAIGRGKAVSILKNPSFAKSFLDDLGLFDTIGYL